MKKSISLNPGIGIRLREVRALFNEGGKISATQFAYLLNTNRDKISNYETGRSSLPLEIIYLLYQRGINPVYLICGEGSMFASNAEGIKFELKINTRANSEVEPKKQNARVVGRIYEGIKLKAAAGMIDDTDDE
ncbi:MAG: hypothetical protein WCR42_12675 [bacterium]